MINKNTEERNEYKRKTLQKTQKQAINALEMANVPQIKTIFNYAGRNLKEKVNKQGHHTICTY